MAGLDPAISHPHQIANDAIPVSNHPMEMTGSSQVMTGWIVACSTSTASAADVIYGAIATPCSLMRPSGTCSNPVTDFFIPTRFFPVHT